MKTPEQIKQQEIFKTIRSLVNEDFVNIEPRYLCVRENFAKRVEFSTEVDLEFEVNGELESFKSHGDGAVHAMVKGLKSHFTDAGYFTMDDFSFSSFESAASISEKFQAQYNIDAEADAKVHTTLGILNSRGQTLTFEGESRSASMAATQVVLNTFEYLVNCELAVGKVGLVLEAHAKGHLVDKDAALLKLSDLVEVNDYKRLMDKLNKRAML